MISLNFDPTNLVLIVAAVLVFWKLKSVLGQRTGFERPPTMPIARVDPNSNVIDLKPNPPKSEPIWKDYAEENSPLAKGLESIASAQKDFNVAEFLDGAKSAYEMILSDFAKGDKPALKSLLSPPVYETFVSAIDLHNANGETKVFKFVGFKATKILNAAMNEKRAAIQVEFNSELINATLDKSGKTIAGDEKAVVETIEAWTFERDVSSRDPNWKLVATSDVVE